VTSGGRLPGGPVAARPDAVGAQADAVLGVLRSSLPVDALLAVCLYGSAVAGGLRPDSDLDLLGVLARPLAVDERRAVVAGLVPVSWRRRRPAGWRPVELTLVVHSEVRPWRFPPRRELQYGEWLREELVAGRHSSAEPDPDLAVLVTMARGNGRPVFGPPPATLFDPVPQADLVRATEASLPPLLADLATDTRNVLLTLARMWCTVETGAIRTEDEAASWAAERLPPANAAILDRARAGYVGASEDRWEDVAATRATADAITTRITARTVPRVPVDPEAAGARHAP
jgi:streptomycin 3"-adenylyltransferase